jgi:hypothetical protein
MDVHGFWSYSSLPNTLALIRDLPRRSYKASPRWKIHSLENLLSMRLTKP